MYIIFVNKNINLLLLATKLFDIIFKNTTLL